MDDARNDDSVQVSFYRAIDQYVLDGGGKFTAWSSYRIDMANGKPRYASTLKGRIKDGVLTTDAGDVNLPFYGNYTYMNQRIRDFRLRMEIGADGTAGKGTAAGYYDVDQLLFYVGGIGPIHSSGMANCPAIYVAAHELADGYPDPKTGKCTALSSAFNFAVVSAFIVHPGRPLRRHRGWRARAAEELGRGTVQRCARRAGGSAHRGRDVCRRDGGAPMNAAPAAALPKVAAPPIARTSMSTRLIWSSLLGASLALLAACGSSPPPTSGAEPIVRLLSESQYRVDHRRRVR